MRPRRRPSRWLRPTCTRPKPGTSIDAIYALGYAEGQAGMAAWLRQVADDLDPPGAAVTA